MDIYEKLDMPEFDRLTATSKKDGESIYNFIKDNNIKRTLEVGFSYGCSAAHIISATQNVHYVIDPYQRNYDYLGIANLKKLNLFQHLIFEEDLSHNVLPVLLKKGITIEFAFIDGCHQFDNIFVDFYYLDLMLEINGFIFLHDLWMFSTQLMVTWILSNKKNYKEIKLPGKSIIGFQKMGNDKREWHEFNDISDIWNSRKISDKLYSQLIDRSLKCHINKNLDEDFIKLLEELDLY